MSLRSTVDGRSILSGLVAALVFILSQTIYLPANAQSPQEETLDKPFVVEYYYKIKWGHADEFIRLFKKNHYPLLMRQLEIGNALEVTAESPVHHGTEDGRWDYRVRIEWKNVQVAHDDSGDEQILQQLFPDQETFEREEQARFEIMLAHWDLPVSSVKLD